MTDYKISKKINDNWKTLGNVKTNQWGNLSLGLHCTEQLKQLINEVESGKWLNLSLFPEKEGDKQ